MRKLILFAFLFGALSSTIFAAKKTVLMEEATSSGWGTCSRGAATVDSLSRKHGENLIALTYHYQIAADNVKFDPMHSYFGEKFGSVANYPNLGYQVDRICPNNKLILGTSFEAALSDVEQYFDFSEVPCSVSIEHNYNSQTREISGKVNINFDDTPDVGDYSLMLVVIQDSILYKQYDYGMSTGFGIPYVDPSIGYLDTFYHNHVVRDGIINGSDSLWGESFASNPSKGETFSVSFNYNLPEKYEFSGPGTITIPAKYDPERVFDNHITLVAYVTRNNSEIVNSTKADLIDDSTPINNSVNKDISIIREGMTVCNGIVFMNTDDISVKTLNVYNYSGKKVASMKGTYRFDLNQLTLSKGQYILKIKSRFSNKSYTKEWIKF